MDPKTNPDLLKQTYLQHRDYFDALVRQDDTENRKRYTISDAIAETAYETIAALQAKKGSPPTWMEVRQHMVRTDFSHIEGMEETKSFPFFKYALYARDKLYLTPCQHYCSMEKWNDDYARFNEKFKARYADPYGYVMDDLNRVKPGPNTKTIDFGELIEVLSSSDQSLLESNSWMFSDLKDPKFLSEKPASGKTPITEREHVTYASYPRCGNSFLRKYLQNITGVATGSDMTLEFNSDLQFSEFKAEEVTDGTVWIKKSHDPKWNRGNKTNLCNKAVVCVRHSYDCMASLMHFLPTLNQGGQINEKFTDVPETWDRMIHDVAEAFEIYHRQVVDNMMPACPVYFIRYEDLRSNPQQTLEEVFCFLLNKRSIEGLNIQRRIKEVVGMGHAASVVYKQKVESHNLEQDGKKPIVFNRNARSMTAQQMEDVSKKLHSFNHLFGYCSEAKEGEALYELTDEWLQEQQTEFNFFKYAKEDFQASEWNKFRKLNEATMDRVLANKETGKEEVYILNLDKPNQMDLPRYPNFMELSMKEVPQVKKE